MKNTQEIESRIQKIKSALADERESVQDLEALIGQRIEVELWGLSKKELEKEGWDSFLYLERNKDCLEEEPIVSHRKYTGPGIVFFKRIFRRLMRPYTKMVLARQRRFNGELIRLNLASLLRLEKIEERVAALETGTPGSRTEKS
jgi:hypothetical protein